MLAQSQEEAGERGRICLVAQFLLACPSAGSLESLRRADSGGAAPSPPITVLLHVFSGLGTTGFDEPSAAVALTFPRFASFFHD